MSFNIEKVLNGRSELSGCWPRDGSNKHLQLDRPGPVWWRADIECRGPLVLGSDPLHHGVHRLLPEQGYGAAAKPAPGHSAPENPGHRQGGLHQHVQLWARDLEVIPEDEGNGGCVDYWCVFPVWYLRDSWLATINFPIVSKSPFMRASAAELVLTIKGC